MKKIGKKIFVLVFIQIFLLMNFGVANNYLLGGAFENSIQEISAEENYCCSETDSGAICQETAEQTINSCKTNLTEGSCEDNENCRLGCCIDDEEGLCSTNTPKGICESEGGIWDNEESCLNYQCQKGCCVLGSDVVFATETRCSRLSSLGGFDTDFRDFETEFECMALQTTLVEGACVLGETCERSTSNECETIGGIFHENELCSSPNFNTSCEKQASIKCVEGEDEIYWFDSCGNKENIYSSDRDASFGAGQILEKNESCGYGDSNIGSEDCGNCAFLLGSQCSETEFGETSVQEGDFICKDLSCTDSEGNKRLNGESWCVYDSYIGEGKDAVGSRHWRNICINGEVKVEPCADYRGQVCVQADIENNGETVSAAECSMNEAVRCFDYNSDMSKCAENKDCMVKTVDVDEGFKFDVCVGRYPRGFDLTGEYESSAKDICSMADQTCKVIYVKKLFQGWVCVMNCDCETSKFANQMNDLCIALGDCGSYVNYVGDGTDNIEVTNSPSISWNAYPNYAEPVDEQIAEPKEMREFLEQVHGEDYAKYGDEGTFIKTLKFIGTISGGIGILFAPSPGEAGPQQSGSSGMDMISLGSGAISMVNLGADVLGFEGFSVMGELAELAGLADVITPAMGAAFSGFGIGSFVGSMVGMAFGLDSESTMVVSIAAGIAGAAAGGIVTAGTTVYAGTGPIASGLAVQSTSASFFSFGGALSATMAAFVWAIVVAVAVSLIMKAMGIGKTKIIEVKFRCHPWQAPLGGENCEMCQDDPLKQCSEYRCSSLGLACGVINHEDENPDCVRMYENDSKAPEISLGKISKGYKFVNENSKGVQIRQEDGSCIPEFTPIVFELNTNEHAQCKFDFANKENYSSMSSFFAESTFYKPTHTGSFMMPSIQSFLAENITGNLTDFYGDFNMNVRCQDTYGNTNSEEYKVNFCVNKNEDERPPVVMVTSPANNSIVSHQENSKDFYIWLNEPSECRFDSLDQEYRLLDNEMICGTHIYDVGEFGWPCRGTAENLEDLNNNFYIRCKDQPWLEDSDPLRNTNNVSLVYSLRKSLEPLKIKKITPQGNVEAGFEPVSIELEVETSGGAEDGIAKCYYKFSQNSSRIQFLRTSKTTHKQDFNLMMGGEHKVYVECEDSANNFIEGVAEFNIEVDNTAPVVIRNYKEGTSLVIVTDEDAECRYHEERCSFDFYSGESLSTIFTKQHSTDWKEDLTYYIKCKDRWGNGPNGCTTIISPLQ